MLDTNCRPKQGHIIANSVKHGQCIINSRLFHADQPQLLSTWSNPADARTEFASLDMPERSIKRKVRGTLYAMRHEAPICSGCRRFRVRNLISRVCDRVNLTRGDVGGAGQWLHCCIVMGINVLMWPCIINVQFPFIEGVNLLKS